MSGGQRERILFELALHRRAGLKRMSVPVPPAAAPAAPPRGTAPGSPATPVATGGLFQVAPVDAPVEERSAALQVLADRILVCTGCKLCETRTKAVPGEGSLDPPILFIGEGPGADEDRTGRPFVGKAGQLLDKMIVAIQYRREQVYIANVVKCRPPGNRNPEPDEVGACLPYLEQQIALLRPRVICTLGLPAIRTLVPTVRSISAVRGKRMSYGGITLIPTFHPAYLLRNPAAKREAWVDLQLVRELAREERAT